MGRATNSPPQFGQRPPRVVSAQSRQKVHSKLQIMASVASGGRSLFQLRNWVEGLTRWFLLMRKELAVPFWLGRAAQTQISLKGSIESSVYLYSDINR
jgi:hypothetical protein